MKRFVLFMFLVGLSSGAARAQDSLNDEFVDPALQTEPEAPPLTPIAPAMKSTNEKPSLPGAFEIQSNEIPQSTEILAEPQIAPTQNFEESYSAASNEGASGEVLYEKQTDYNLKYKQRRGRHGILFSIDYEKFYPTDYFSQYRDVYIEDKLDTGFDLVGPEIGYKFNFALGSIGILANYASGSIKGKIDADQRTINLQRYGLSANFALDNIFNEPWVVPYVQAGVHQFLVSESSAVQKNSLAATTDYSYNYRFGALFQLDWIEKAIDPSTEFDGFKGSGLQNTFLDVYVVAHAAAGDTFDPDNSESEGSPDLSSGLDLGVGLKMEF